MSTPRPLDKIEPYKIESPDLTEAERKKILEAAGRTIAREKFSDIVSANADKAEQQLKELGFKSELSEYKPTDRIMRKSLSEFTADSDFAEKRIHVFPMLRGFEDYQKYNEYLKKLLIKANIDANILTPVQKLEVSQAELDAKLEQARQEKVKANLTKEKEHYISKLNGNLNTLFFDSHDVWAANPELAKRIKDLRERINILESNWRSPGTDIADQIKEVQNINAEMERIQMVEVPAVKVAEVAKGSEFVQEIENHSGFYGTRVQAKEAIKLKDVPYTIENTGEKDSIGNPTYIVRVKLDLKEKEPYIHKFAIWISPEGFKVRDGRGEKICDNINDALKYLGVIKSDHELRLLNISLEHSEAEAALRSAVNEKVRAGRSPVLGEKEKANILEKARLQKEKEECIFQLEDDASLGLFSELLEVKPYGTHGKTLSEEIEARINQFRAGSKDNHDSLYFDFLSTRSQIRHLIDAALEQHDILVKFDTYANSMKDIRLMAENFSGPQREIVDKAIEFLDAGRDRINNYIARGEDRKYILSKLEELNNWTKEVEGALYDVFEPEKARHLEKLDIALEQLTVQTQLIQDKKLGDQTIEDRLHDIAIKLQSIRYNWATDQNRIAVAKQIETEINNFQTELNELRKPKAVAAPAPSHPPQYTPSGAAQPKKIVTTSSDPQHGNMVDKIADQFKDPKADCRIYKTANKITFEGGKANDGARALVLQYLKDKVEPLPHFAIISASSDDAKARLKDAVNGTPFLNITKIILNAGANETVIEGKKLDDLKAEVRQETVVYPRQKP